MSEEEIIKQINNVIYDLNAVNEDWYTIDEIETAKEQVKYIQGLLDLYNKQKEKIKELKLITTGYDSYLGENMGGYKIIIADSKYFLNGTFVERNISKDKIRKKLLEPIKEELSKLGETFMNKAPEILTRSFEVEGTAMQELSWAKGRIEELLEEK